MAQAGLSKLRHASLFSGIGGFDLAADWMGWHNVLQFVEEMMGFPPGWTELPFRDGEESP